MTLEQLEAKLRCILEKHYAQDSSIRYDPLFRDLDALLQKLSRAVELAEDAANIEAAKAWEARKWELDHEYTMNERRVIQEP